MVIMANGFDSEELSVSENVERGLKRDFDSGVEVKICGEDDSESSGNKRLKRMNVVATDELSGKGVSDVEDGKSDVVDWLSEDELTNRVAESEQVEGMNSKTSNVVEKDFKAYEDEPTSNLIESPTTEDIKDDQTMLVKANMDRVEFLNNEDSSRDGVESLCEAGDMKDSLERPCQRLPVASELLLHMEKNEVSMECDAGEEDGSGCHTRATSPEKVKKVFTRSVLAKLFPNFPKKLKDFLDTGILEGTHVKYIRGSKSRGFSETEFPGIIRGSGILCFCKVCNGNEVVSPNLFEIHAGSGNKRPPEYMQLHNEKTLRDVMNACKNAPLDKIEKSFQAVIRGASVKIGSVAEAGPRSSKLITNSCESRDQGTQASFTETTQTITDDERYKTLTCYFGGVKIEVDRQLLLPQSPIRRGHLVDPQEVKARESQECTKRFIDQHKALFSRNDGLEEGTELRYMINSQTMLVGSKKGSGICCSCCNSVVTPSMFEAHAGYASRRRPFQNIYDLNRRSLHELAVDMDSEQSTKDDDDCRTLCLRGGDLISCDACPRAFHIECASLQSRPTEKWLCKKCANQSGAYSSRKAGNYSRIVKNPPPDIGGCVICKLPHFSNSHFGPQTVMLCDQCEKEYHVGCLRESHMQDLQELPEDMWFCCEDCEKIHSTLDRLVSEGEKELSESLLNNIKHKNDEESRVNMEIKWRLIRGKDSSDECKLMLTEVVGIFRDRFGLIPDTAPGPSRPDLIPVMVRGEKLRERDFGGMYCALLTVNSIVVSALLVRVYGQELAEVPLVATTNKHEGKGYFRALFQCIEELLGSMDVKTIVLPAADEAKAIWLGNFGFNTLTNGELEQYSRHHDLMTFQGISWLKKTVPPSSV